MTPFLLQFLVDPINGKPLKLDNPKYDLNGNIISGCLYNDNSYHLIIDGIPRFINTTDSKSVKSFGNQWNYFNFINFKQNWLMHTVTNTFGSTKIFRNKLIIDAGGGSGSQTKWFLEYGAKHVILLDLSHSVDDVVKKNLKDIDPKKYDIIQCSIDNPPLLQNSIEGIIYCHNVIQHTPSVERTADALYKLLAPSGEFVFNCYGVNDKGALRWIRWNFIYKPLRIILKNLPFSLMLLYSHTFAFLRFIPVLGILLEKSYFIFQGDIPNIKNESFFKRLKRKYQNTVLNTFDAYGSHKYQWHKTNDEIKNLLNSFSPKPSKILNKEKYFRNKPPIGIALRVFR